MRSGLYPVIADMIVGNGNRKKDVQSLYLTVSDADLVASIDRMRYDKGETEIWVFGLRNGRLQRCDVPVEIWLRCATYGPWSHCESTGQLLRIDNYVSPEVPIVGHGDRKKDVRSRYLSISDADLLDAIDRMSLDLGDTDIGVTVREQGKRRGHR